MIISKQKRLDKLEKVAPPAVMIFQTQTLREIQAQLKDEPGSDTPFSLPKIWQQIREA